jgi:uncharacterized MnhB-related membrane protein
LLAGILKNALNVSRSLKERKIRRYSSIVFILSAVVSLLAVLRAQFFTSVDSLLSLLVSNLFVILGAVNVALVTYLLGNIKKELDRLSWTIISMAIIGMYIIAFGGFLTVWAAVIMIFVAGLLNFVEPDE